MADVTIEKNPIDNNPGIETRRKERDLSRDFWHGRRDIDIQPNPTKRRLIDEVILPQNVPASAPALRYQEGLESTDPDIREKAERVRRKDAERKLRHMQREEKLLREHPDLAAMSSKERQNISRLEEIASLLGEDAKIRGRAPEDEIHGELLRKRKTGDWMNEDWSKWGWDNQHIREVGRRLSQGFEVHTARGGPVVIRLNDAQIHTALELFVSSGQSSDDYIRKFEGDLLNEQTKAFIDDYEGERSLSKANREKLVKEVFFNQLGVSDEYLRKFIYSHEFQAENQEEYERKFSPDNIEDLAWQIMSRDYALWGVNGKFPVLEMRLKRVEDDATGEERTVGDYYVNTANLTRFIRERMNYWIGEEPKSPHNYFQQIFLLKSLGSHFTIQDMFEAEETVFKSKDGETSYKDLGYHWRVEAAISTFLRDLELNYETLMSKDQELVNKFVEMSYMNPLTRKIFDKNILWMLVNVPMEYDHARSDVKLGSAWNEMQLFYYHLSDFEKLQRLLGRDSRFFTKEGMLQGLSRVINANQVFTPEKEVIALIGPEGYQLWNNIWDKNGRIKDPKSFIEFINFFDYHHAAAPDNQQRIVREALKMHIAEKYDTYGESGELDVASLNWMELMALSYSRISGASARNELKGLKYDALTGPTNASIYRRRQLVLGGRYGYEGTIEQYRQLLPTLMEGMQTEAYTQVKDENGRTVGVRHKSTLEVMEELQQVRSRQMDTFHRLQEEVQEAEGDEQVKKRRELEQFAKAIDNEYDKVAGQLEFTENTMRYYAQEVVANMEQVFRNVITSTSFDFDKYTEHTLFGIKFKRAEFQEAMMENFFRPLRVAFKKYKGINFNQTVRGMMPVGPHGQMEYRDVTLVEHMFGYEILDRPEFWILNKFGKPEIDKRTGRHKIDANKINTDWGRVVLWKSVALMELGNRLRQHIQLTSTDPRYNFTYYLDVVDTLKSLPGDVVGDDESVRHLKHSKKFFSKEDIRYLKRISGVTNTRMYRSGFSETFFMPRTHEGNGVSDALKAFFHAISQF